MARWIKMKSVVIVHGWGDDSESGWIPWLASELRQKGIETIAPDMPNTETPKIGEWVPFLAGQIKNSGSDLFLVGHSIGCQAILRYLETLPEGSRIGGTVLVAGWTTLAGLSDGEKAVAEPWENTPIDWQKVSARAGSFICIYSDNDPYVPEANAQLLREKLNARLVLDSGQGHFSEENDVTQLPVALNELLTIMGLPIDAAII